MQRNRVHRFLGRVAATVAALSLLGLSAVQAAPEKLKDSVLRQIQALQQEKANRTPQMLKMDSHLVHAVRINRHENIGIELHPLVKLHADGRAIVDINAVVNPALLDGIAKVGGTVDFSSEQFHAVRARIPLSKLEKVADMKGVKFIKRAAEAITHTGTVDSEGDVTHKADLARSTFGVDGTGVKVGVLSDSIDFLTQAQSTGDLPPNITVLPNQGGFGAGEGTAMMEIVYDLAPGAQLFFATAFNSEASFAQNIINLRKAGCDVIVDDVFYFDESPFQDGPVAQAVNTVTADGAIYFAAAGNEGNKDHNNSGTWEGDFVDGGAAGAPVNGKGGNVHLFGTNAYDIVDQPGFATVLFWSDPAGASTNDYDLYVLDSTGANVINSSTTVQNGNQDPYEIAQPTASGQRIVIVKAAGADGRFLHIDTIRGNLRDNTAGNITGHSAAEFGFGVAAVDQHRAFPNPFSGGAANPVETFSTDGPRRKFYQANGTPYTPGDFSSTGGRVLQKPDIAAADGVTTTVPGFAPFYGTSAAAPHAAAICALLKSYNPNLDTNQVRTVLTSSALDNERNGIDRDSGAGIVMALEALTASPVPVPTPNLQIFTNILTGGNNNGIIDPDECNNLDLIITNRGTGPATAITAILSTTTPGVIVALKSITYPDLAPGQSSIGRASFKISTTTQFLCGTPVDLTVVLSSAEASKTNSLRLPSGIIGLPYTFANNVPAAIPDANPIGIDVPMVVSNVVGNISRVTVSLYLNHTFDSDLEIDLVAPDNTRVILSQFSGGAGHDYGISCNNAPCTFDDGAAIPISTGNPPFAGNFIPQQLLAAFNLKSGTNVNGTWKLHISDNALLDTGTLNCWKLNIFPAICSDGGGECPGSDLSVTMTDNPDPVLVTSNLTYTMVISNAGPATAKSVVLNQVLPPTVQFLTASNSQGVVTNALNTVTASLGVIPVYGTATVAVVVVPLTNGIITSTANVGSPAFDSDPLNNSATVVTRVEKPTADVALTLTGTPNPALDGGSITYTVKVTNNGPFTATGVVVTNILPANSVFLSASTSQGTFANSGNSVLALLGNVSTGMTATVTFIVAPTSTGIATATAQVAEDPFITDPLPGNNRATVSIAVKPAADIAVTAVATPQQALLGSNVTYTITVTNRGPDLATGVVLSQVLPSGAVLISATSTRGIVTTNAGSVTVSMGSMAAGANGIATVVVRAPSVSTTLISIMNVSSAQPDPNLLNNSVTVRTIVSPPFTRLVAAGATMTAENFLPRNGIVDIGETVTLQFALQNTGNAVAAGVTATLLPTGGVTSPSGIKSYGSLGSGDIATAPFTFTASGANGATLTATLQLQTNGVNAGTVTYIFTLPNTTVFSNTNAITIVDATASAPSPAMPYPSTIQVSGVTGFVSRVTVSLANLTHTFPDDIGSVVVHPSGRTSVLMAHAGGGLAASNLNLTFDRSSSTAVPDDSQLTSTQYAPASYGDTAYAFPTNFALPVGPYQPNLAGFEGTDPNGDWSLFVADDSPGDHGNVANGWSVAVTTGTPVSPIAELSVNSGLLGNAQGSILIGNSANFEVVVKNNGPFDATGVSVTNVLSSGLSLVSVTTPPFVSYVTNGQSIIFSAPTLAFGSNLVFTIVAQATAAGTQTDTISIGANEVDVNLQNNTAVQSVIVNPLLADGTLTVSASPSTVTIGNNFLYTFNIVNGGPNASVGTSVTALLPNGFNYVGSTVSQGSVSIYGQTLVISLGTLAPSAVATATVTIAPTLPGTFTNVFYFNSLSQDPNYANNIFPVVSTVVQPVPVITATGVRLVSENGTVNGALDQYETIAVEVTFANTGTAPTTNLQADVQNSGGIQPVDGFKTIGVIAPGGTAKATFSIYGTESPGRTNIMSIFFGDASTYFFPMATFPFVVPSTGTFANGSTILIPASGPASPYPSTITISNTPGVVGKAVLKLNKVTHSFPRDINVLLVSPTGQSVLAMSHCGGAHSLTNVDITIDDEAAVTMSASNQVSSGTYLPSVYSPGVSFPGITAPPTGPGLSALNGSTANGTWLLYVLDDNAGDAGSIGGWSLTLSVANTVNPASALSLTMSSTPPSALTANFIDYVINVVNAGPSAANNVVIADTLPAGVSLVSAAIASGTTDVSGNVVNCRLSSLASGASATAFIRVQPVAAGSLTNTATVSADTSDLYSVNNFATVVNTATLAADAHLAGAYIDGTGYRLVLTGQTGEPYTVQFSTNLTSWISISTVTPVNGTFTITDSAATSANTRYYRAFRTPH